MIRNMLLGFFGIAAIMLVMLGMAMAQSYLATVIDKPFGDVVFGFVMIIAVLLVFESWRRFAR